MTTVRSWIPVLVSTPVLAYLAIRAGPYGDLRWLEAALIVTALVILALRDRLGWLRASRRRDRRALVVFGGFLASLVVLAGVLSLFR
jgi:hypothetical protein